MHSTLFHHVLTILLLAGWSLITTGGGRLCLRATSLRYASRGETIFLSAGVGLTVTAYTVFILGIAQSLHAFAIITTMIALALLALSGWRRRDIPLLHPASPDRWSAWDRPAAVLLAAVLSAGFLLVLTPETGKDALIYHLAVPKLYLKHQGFYFIPGNIFAGYPLLGEMHYLLALFFKNDILARAMHFAVLCWTLLGISLFTRHQMRDNAFPALGMLIFASIPSVFAVSHMAYNDLFVTFFTLAAVFTFLRWSEQRLSGWLILCAVFSGSAAACKYTALLLLPLGCLGILWFSQRNKSHSGQALRRIALYAAVVFAVGSPFYLKNLIVTGNPFYPFFHGIFGGRGWDSDQARLYDIFIQNLGMGRDLFDYLLLPWNLSFRARMDSPQFDGILGPLFLFTLPFLAGIRRWEMPVRVLIAYAVPAFLFWASSAQQIRYLIPLFALLAIVTGAILTRYRERKAVFCLLLILIGGSLTFNGYHIAREFVRTSPVRAAAGLESRDSFLTRMIPTFSMYRFANRELPSQSSVFLLYMKNYTFLCDRACYADSMFEAHTLQKILRDSLSPEGVRDRLRTAGFTHLLYDEAYLLGDLSPLSPEEKRLFLAFRERRLAPVNQSGAYRLDRLN